MNVNAPGLGASAHRRRGAGVGLTFRSNSRKSRLSAACELATTGIDCYGRDHSLPLHRVVISSFVKASHPSYRIIQGCVPSHFIIFFHSAR